MKHVLFQQKILYRAGTGFRSVLENFRTVLNRLSGEVSGVLPEKLDKGQIFSS